MLCDGKLYAKWAPSVTHVIAADRSYPFAAHVKQGLDILCMEWLLDCDRTRTLVPAMPHHYLHLSQKTTREVPDICRFGDL